jgi:hypothetical protein
MTREEAFGRAVECAERVASLLDGVASHLRSTGDLFHAGIAEHDAATLRALPDALASEPGGKKPKKGKGGEDE